ncbi:trp operon leader peptide [Streptomyces sp. NPDC002054]
MSVRSHRHRCRVYGMFAHPNQTCQNWWWTAHPAAH